METSKNLDYTEEEDKLIVKHVCTIGKKWKRIAQSFDGKTANSVKSRWYRYLKFEVVKKPYLLDFYTKKEVEAGIGLLSFWTEFQKK